MPNYCDFDIHVKGKKRDILTLFDWMNANYRYTEPDESSGGFKTLPIPECYVQEGDKRRDVPHHIGYRIFEANIVEEMLEGLDDSDECCIYGWGYCAWSVYSCMFEGVHTYYSDKKDYPVSLSLTLPNACKELNLKAEIYSSEPGMCFAEHYLISNEGEILKDECIEYFDLYIDDFKSFDDYVAAEYENEGESVVTKEQFDKAKEEGSCSITLCEWLNSGEWPFVLV